MWKAVPKDIKKKRNRGNGEKWHIIFGHCITETKQKGQYFQESIETNEGNENVIEQQWEEEDD